MTQTDIRLLLAERAMAGFEGPRSGPDFEAVTGEWESSTVAVVKAARARGEAAISLLETIGRGLAVIAAPVVEKEVA